MAMNGVHGALGPLRSLPEVVRASPKLGVWLYFAMPVLLIALGVASILAWGEVAMFIVVLASGPYFVCRNYERRHGSRTGPTTP